MVTIQQTIRFKEVNIELVLCIKSICEENKRTKYKFSIKNGDKVEYFDFYGSRYDFEVHQDSKPLDALTTILNEANCISELIFGEEWCLELDFDYNNKKERNKAEDYYNYCERVSKKLEKLGLYSGDLFIYCSTLNDLTHLRHQLEISTLTVF